MSKHLLAKQRVIALSLLVLAVIFIWFFQVTKHDQDLMDINPFAEDPFDATGSFGTIFAMFIAIISLFSAFVSPKALTTERQLVLLRRTIAGVLSIVTTLLMDGVALARYPGLWIKQSGGEILALLVTIFFVATISFSLFVYFSFRGEIDSARKRDKVVALICCTAAIGLEAFLPENTHAQGIVGAIVAIVVGVLVLFAVVRTTAVVIVSYSKQEVEQGRRYWWWQAVVFGLLLGFAISQIEGLAESGHLGQLSPVAVFFTLVGCGGVCIAYAFVARPLGFFSSRDKHKRQKHDETAADGVHTSPS